ncbi:MAG: Flp family type IVb pilin [Actinomycetota bacterium]|nr:Flp family type IVb pilin [Actinomycetota bacterium]
MKLAVRTHLFLTQIRDEKGASAVEYGLLVALIAAIIVAAVLTLGQTVLGAFNDTNDGITAG